MQIHQITSKYFGPFYIEFTLNLEEDVTVLTGANDVGKTSLLDLIEFVCGIQGATPMQEKHVNFDYLSESGKSWRSDGNLKCHTLVSKADLRKSKKKSEFPNGTRFRLHCTLAPDIRQVKGVDYKKDGAESWTGAGNLNVGQLPKVIRLPAAEEIGSIIELQKPNASEMRFCKAVFGDGFSPENFWNLTPARKSQNLSRAKTRANEVVAKYFPRSFGYVFDFQFAGDQQNSLGIYVEDKFTGHAEIGRRGAGLQKLASIAVTLATEIDSDRHNVVLLDEPENSLHADSQHQLRTILESIAARPNCQVVYTTHSPSMINSFTPRTLRLVERTKVEEVATSTINDRPFDLNFHKIRVSLGVTPADSLLYGPITLIVEGPTECLAIPILIERLLKEKPKEFKDLPILMSQVHIVDGQGDSWSTLCKFAIQNRSQPVVFLDGDKRNDQRVRKLREKFPGIPIVFTSQETEFEELVPSTNYFDALRQLITEQFEGEVSVDFLTETSFENWLEDNPQPAKKAFSKKVDDFVADRINISINKPATMAKAIRAVPIDDVLMQPIEELINAVRQVSETVLEGGFA